MPPKRKREADGLDMEAHLREVSLQHPGAAPYWAGKFGADGMAHLRSNRHGEDGWKLADLRVFTGAGASDRYDNPPANTPPPPVPGESIGHYHGFELQVKLCNDMKDLELWKVVNRELFLGIGVLHRNTATGNGLDLVLYNQAAYAFLKWILPFVTYRYCQVAKVVNDYIPWLTYQYLNLPPIPIRATFTYPAQHGGGQGTIMFSAQNAVARLANTQQSNLSRSFHQAGGPWQPGVDRTCQHNITIYNEDGTSFRTRATLQEVNHWEERMKAYFLRHCDVAVYLHDQKQADESPMADDLDDRLRDLLHALGFICGDAKVSLKIQKTAAAKDVQFRHLRARDVSSAALKIDLKQKRKQVIKQWSLLEGAPQAGGTNNGVSFWRTRQENPNGGEYRGYQLTFSGETALAKLKAMRAACHAPATRMPWHWVEKHAQIDELLKVEAAAQLPELQRKAEWLRIERACRAMRSS